MSGGHWGYMSSALTERGESSREVYRFLAVAEHELDWGVCSDTCLDCAKLRVAEGLLRFFDTRLSDATAAIAIARDRDQHRCIRCQR